MAKAQKIDKQFVSDEDKFLNELWKEIPESDSQRRERKKHERIAHLRDNEVKHDEDNELWEGF